MCCGTRLGRSQAPEDRIRGNQSGQPGDLLSQFLTCSLTLCSGCILDFATCQVRDNYPGTGYCGNLKVTPATLPPKSPHFASPASLPSTYLVWLMVGWGAM